MKEHGMINAKEIMTKEEYDKIQWILKLFKGKVVKIGDSDDTMSKV
jgi:hypothetical protein